jgi:hypothetical protein
MRFDTLMALVKRGQVTAQSVVRGPTTNQFWRFAAQVKGLSREFGVCYNCATPIEKTATICPSCNRMQEPPANPDVLLENAPTAAAATAPVTPPAPAPVPMPAVTTPVHREIKPPAPTPAPAPAAAPAFAPAAAAAATIEKPAFAPPQRSASPRRERDREPAPARRDEVPQRTDLLAPPHRQRALPKQRTADDGILSARDLATAFQLDFKPDTHRGGSLKRIALVAVLLGVSGVAIAAIVSPGFRDGARMWFADKATALRSAVTGRPTTPTAPPPKQSSIASASPAPKTASAAGPATRPNGKSPEELYPLPALPAQPVEAIAAKPETQPASQAKPAQVAAPTAPAPAAPAPTQITIAPVPSAPRGAEPTTRPAQQAKEPAKDQPVAKVAAAPVDAAKAREQALSLWRQALDAEARRDYAKAVEHYEAIQKLPRSTWPAGLEINLKYAKARVK